MKIQVHYPMKASAYLLMANSVIQWLLGLKKLYAYNQGWILGEKKEAGASGPLFQRCRVGSPFESFALTCSIFC